MSYPTSRQFSFTIMNKAIEDHESKFETKRLEILSHNSTHFSKQAFVCDILSVNGSEVSPQRIDDYAKEMVSV